MRSKVEITPHVDTRRMQRSTATGAEYAAAGRSVEELVQTLLGEATDSSLMLSVSNGVAAYLQAQRERRTRWIGYFVHELRNPLSSLSSALWLLREDTSRVGAEQVLTLADRAIARMDGAVTALLGLDRCVEKGEPKRSSAMPPGAVQAAR